MLFDSIQHTSPPAQSAASLHATVVPAHGVPAGWHDAVPLPIGVDSQQMLPGTLHVLLPHAIVPGEAGNPPSGAEHEPPPASSGPMLLLEAVELEVSLEVNVEELSVLEVNVELEWLLVDVPTVLEPVPLPPLLDVPHDVGVPNASVRPHASGSQRVEKPCALPTHVSSSWNAAPRPLATALAWSAAHEPAHPAPGADGPL